jgi:hypothetical protein
LPHDLVHLTVEDALAMNDGIWAAIAGGIVFSSMDHVSGRRPPHAAERSARLAAAFGASLGRAELIGGFVERLAHIERADVAAVGALARTHLSTLPEVPYEPTRLLRAAARVREASAHWQALPVGTELTRTWPPYRRMELDQAGPRSRRQPTRRRAARR